MDSTKKSVGYIYIYFKPEILLMEFRLRCVLSFPSSSFPATAVSFLHAMGLGGGGGGQMIPWCPQTTLSSSSSSSKIPAPLKHTPSERPSTLPPQPGPPPAAHTPPPPPSWLWSLSGFGTYQDQLWRPGLPETSCPHFPSSTSTQTPTLLVPLRFWSLLSPAPP